MRGPETASKRALLALGFVLVIAAAVLTGPTIEHAMGASSLSWGTTLFRVLLAWHGMLLVVAGLAPWRRSQETRATESTPHAAWLALIVISALALALRLFRLDSCLWLDEVLTMLDYGRAPLGAVLTDFSSQNQHMFFSVLANLSLRVFGEHAWALRLPSVVFGIGSIWALFLLGRRLLPVTEALGACALMAFSYHHVWFSQNARGYMGLLFFTLLGTWLWREALARDRWPLWIAYAVTCALGAWVHMTMIFVVAAHVVVYAIFYFRPGSAESRAGVRPLAAFALCATLAIQLHALALPGFFSQALHEASPPSSEWTSPLWAAAEMVRRLSIGFAGIIVLLCGGAVMVAGWVSILRRDPDTALTLALPGLIGGGIMLASGHNLWPRFFFFLMGFCVLICVRGGASLARKLLPERLASPAIAGGICLVVLASAATLPRCYALPKQDFTGARDFLSREMPSSSTVAVVGLAGHAYRYYAPAWNRIESEEALGQLLQHRQELALVYTLPIELAGFHPALWKSVQENFDTWRVFPGTLGGGEVFVCRPKPSHIAGGRISVTRRGIE